MQPCNTCLYRFPTSCTLPVAVSFHPMMLQSLARLFTFHIGRYTASRGSLDTPLVNSVFANWNKEVTQVLETLGTDMITSYMYNTVLSFRVQPTCSNRDCSRLACWSASVSTGGCRPPSRSYPSRGEPEAEWWSVHPFSILPAKLCRRHRSRFLSSYLEGSAEKDNILNNVKENGTRKENLQVSIQTHPIPGIRLLSSFGWRYNPSRWCLALHCRPYHTVWT